MYVFVDSADMPCTRPPDPLKVTSVSHTSLNAPLNARSAYTGASGLRVAPRMCMLCSHTVLLRVEKRIAVLATLKTHCGGS